MKKVILWTGNLRFECHVVDVVDYYFDVVGNYHRKERRSDKFSFPVLNPRRRRHGLRVLVVQDSVERRRRTVE